MKLKKKIVIVVSIIILLLLIMYLFMILVFNVEDKQNVEQTSLNAVSSLELVVYKPSVDT
ncbi:hypothetical protein BBD41_11405 [Paenibacillus ihbetae]|uniref:Uncharacterized protein n=1 Tax=Paenibacillus ihbetae TaxID=1870820 RepID=A0A1B2DZH7_9BACL|nr:hypothetical protein BBD41_11405 [Paenibacillus ihbetae]